AAAKLGQDEKMTYLQRVQLFEACSVRQLRAIARIADVQEVPAGNVLARTGEPGDRFFVIVDGAARIEISPHHQNRMGPGAFFGEMSLLDGEPRSATITATTDVRLLVVERTHFWRLLDETPEVTRRILGVLSRRVRRLEQAANALLRGVSWV
ncbi:MAG TPA: cyclic nucleotide-binding domain-containing protein, partial [Methylomirabilota bacterium]